MIQKIFTQLQIIRHGHYDMSTPEGRDLERSRNIAITALTAIIAKGVAILIPLITVRITLGYLGEETYGLWSTVTSFFALFAYADLGLGSGLQTELSRASALKDTTTCRKMISTTYMILFVVCCFLLTVFALIYPYVNWASIVNAQTPETTKIAGVVVLAILVPKLINIPMAIIERAQNAMQEGYRTHLWRILGNVLSLIFVVAISLLDGGKITMIAASASIIVIVELVNMLIYFGKQRPELRPGLKYFDKKIGKKLLTTGVAFFILSIFTSLSLSIDNWVVAQVSSLSLVTSYSIMLRMTNVLNVISIMLSTPMWSANGEALERGEYEWVRKKTRSIANLSAVLAGAGAIGIIVLCKPALWLLTDSKVEADFIVLLGMCFLNILLSYTNPYFMILNSARVIKFQIGNYIIYSAISLYLKFTLGNFYGMRAIPWIGSITYLLLLTIPTMWRANKVLKDEAKRFETHN